MTGNIIDKIKDEVQKSGHPVSLKVSQILDKKQWFVKNAPRFQYHKDDENLSEIDVVGVRKSKFIVDSWDNLIIECKKQDKPWVFFSQDNRNTDVFTITTNRLTENGSQLYDWLDNNGKFKSHYYYGKQFSTYFFVALTKIDSNEAKTLDRALYQVLKALIFYVLQQEENTKIKFFYPIIVFEGDLYAAYYKNEELFVEERNHICLYVEAELPKMEKVRTFDGKYVKWIESKPFIIDVVKLEYFNEFLKNFESK